MCVEFNRSGKFLSVGLKHGGVAVYIVNMQGGASSSRQQRGFSSRGSSRSSIRSYASTSAGSVGAGESKHDYVCMYV